MVLSARQERQLAVRDDLAPGAKPAAIIPRNFLEAQQLCQALAASSLVPKAYRSATGAVDMLLVVMTGSELGIPPMAALRLFTTWDGVPRLMAEGIRAVMMMASDIEYFEMSTADDKHATWIGKRRGRPEKSVTWTMERAKRAGLADKAVWKAYQENMLNARASMELGRILAPDIISGMRSLEEAQDGDFLDVTATERKPEFAAPPVQVVVPQGPPPGVPAPEAPKPRAGRLPKDKPIDAKSAEAFNASTPGANAPVPTSAAGASASAATTSDGSDAPSTASTDSPRADLASKLDQSIAVARAADAARNPTPPSSPSEPSPSTESAAVSTVESGAAGADEAFGEDPVDAPPTPSGNRLADFFVELSKCVNQREVSEVGNRWRVWSRVQAESGDLSYGKNGENAAKMGKMYAARKAEVPA